MADKAFPDFELKATLDANDQIISWDGNQADPDLSYSRTPYSWFTTTFSLKSELSAHENNGGIHVKADQSAALDANATLNAGNAVASLADVPDAYTKTEQNVTDGAQDARLTALETDSHAHADLDRWDISARVSVGSGESEPVSQADLTETTSPGTGVKLLAWAAGGALTWINWDKIPAGGGTTLHANLTDTDTDGHPGSVINIAGGVQGNAVSIDASGNLVDSGVPPGGAGGTTDLSIINRTATTYDTASSSGQNATNPAATQSLAGLFSAADKTAHDTRLPTADEKAAMTAANAPATGNAFATMADVGTVRSTPTVTKTVGASGDFATIDEAITYYDTLGATFGKDSGTIDAPGLRLLLKDGTHTISKSYAIGGPALWIEGETLGGASIEISGAGNNALIFNAWSTEFALGKNIASISVADAATGTTLIQAKASTAVIVNGVGLTTTIDGFSLAVSISGTGYIADVSISNFDYGVLTAGIGSCRFGSNISFTSGTNALFVNNGGAILYETKPTYTTVTNETNIPLNVVASDGSYITDDTGWIIDGSIANHWFDKTQEGAAATYAATDGQTVIVSLTSSGTIDLTTPVVAVGTAINFGLVIIPGPYTPTIQINGSAPSFAPALPTWASGNAYTFNALVTNTQTLLMGGQELS